MFSLFSSFFFFNATATTEIYTLSLHDALPIFFKTFDEDFDLVAALDPHLSVVAGDFLDRQQPFRFVTDVHDHIGRRDLDDFSDRKSTRLNSSHSQISYAVFCLKQKKKKKTTQK